MNMRNFLLGRPLSFNSPDQVRALEQSGWPEEVWNEGRDTRPWGMIRCIRCHGFIYLRYANGEVITPRIYGCKSCAHRILAFRTDQGYDTPEMFFEVRGLVFINLGAYQRINPLDFVSHDDPYKFYQHYNLI